jgi:hypothetical protein
MHFPSQGRQFLREQTVGLHNASREQDRRDESDKQFSKLKKLFDGLMGNVLSADFAEGRIRRSQIETAGT